MKPQQWQRAGTPRRLAMACIAALGLMGVAGIGGCGGSSGCLLPPCVGDFPDEPVQPVVAPATVATRVGAAAGFSVRANGITNPTYQWSRAPRGGAATAIAGATGSIYTLARANLADDGATYSVQVRGSFAGKPVVLESTRSQLVVSSMPGIVFEDRELPNAAWSAVALSEYPTTAPTRDEQQVSTGGNPGAYRSSTIVMPPGPSRLAVFQANLTANYAPATQGAVYVIESTLDCLQLPGTLVVSPVLLLEQGTRRYTAGRPAQCNPTAGWSATTQAVFGANAADFVQVDGPACSAGAMCPDFSANGQPIRFGFATQNEGLAGFAGGTGGVGVDNWKVTVWRR